MDFLTNLPPEKPILIAGPTASGKSGLALRIAQRYGGAIINADSMQVYSCWRVLTARPSEAEESMAEHHLYGHIACGDDYSVGDWLRNVSELLKTLKARPIIVGGTGLYFKALTQGLAEIPATSPEVRETGNTQSLDQLRDTLDDETLSRIDQQNRARVQRAWEVQHQTGRRILDWQNDTGPALLPLDDVSPLLLRPDTAALNDRIERRFDMMLSLGALNEVKQQQSQWSPVSNSAKAIGAKQLMSYLNGENALDQVRESSIIATRQYAKRQRTWFRSNMKNWKQITDLSTVSSTE